MNLHTIMTSFTSMAAFKEKLIAYMADTESTLEERAITYTFTHPSTDCILINMSLFLTTFYNDDLMPKDPVVYDSLCTALTANNYLGDSFTYEEIQYSNRNEFFKDCTPDDLIAFTAVLITEYLAYKFEQSDRQKVMLLNPYSSDIDFLETEDIHYHLKDYSCGELHMYPVAVMLMSNDDEIVFENLDIIKDCLTVFKKDDIVAANDKTLANLALPDVQTIAEDKIMYYTGKILDTRGFKDSDSAFCRFLYNITRSTIEINSTTNIKAIFDNLKEMVGNVSNRTLNDWFKLFILTNKSASNLVIAYMQRLAAKNNEALENSRKNTVATFDYDDTVLFTISKAKA